MSKNLVELAKTGTSRALIELIKNTQQYPKETIKAMLQLPNESDSEGRLPIHWAAQYGNLDTLKSMHVMAKGYGVDADVNVQTKGSRCTPLHYALKNRHYTAVALLLSLGADPKVLSPATSRTMVNDIDTVFQLKTAFLWAAKENKIELLQAFDQALLAIDCDWSLEYTARTKLPLTILNAAESNSVASLRYLIKTHDQRRGQQRKIKDILLHADDGVHGRAQIHWAAIHGDATLIKQMALVSYVALGDSIVNLPSKMYGLTPLHYAANNRNLEAVSALLQYGADPGIKDKTGRNMLDHIFLRPNNFEVFMETFKHLSAPETDELGTRIKKKLLPLLQESKSEADDDKPCYIEKYKQLFLTTFHQAAQLNRLDVVKFMLPLLAQMDVDWTEDVSKKTGIPYAITVAAENGSLDCLKFLVTRMGFTLRDSISSEPLHPLQPHPKSAAADFHISVFHEIADAMPDMAEFEDALAEAHQIDLDLTRAYEDPGAQILDQQEKVASYSTRLSSSPRESIAHGCYTQMRKSNAEKVNRKLAEYIELGNVLFRIDTKGQLVGFEEKLTQIEDTLKYLGTQGLDINAHNKFSRTPLYGLIQRKPPVALVQAFINAGAKPTGSELHLAIKTGSPGLVECLLSAKAPVDWKNKRGQNAFDVLYYTHNPLMENARPRLFACMGKDIKSYLPKYEATLTQEAIEPEARMLKVFAELKLKCEKTYQLNQESDMLRTSHSSGDIVMSNDAEATSAFLPSYAANMNKAISEISRLSRLKSGKDGNIKPSKILSTHSGE